MAVPPLYHWYNGEPPPLIGVAVKVTLWPLQTVLPEPERILTAGVMLPEIEIVIEFDVAFVVVTHCEFETILHEITSPLIRLLVE